MALRNKRQDSGRTYAGQSPKERLRERRERLLRSSFDLFTSRGYHNTTVEKICSEARVTTRHFYQHFGNREALLEAHLLRLREELTQVILKNLELKDDPMTRADKTLQAFVSFYLGDSRRARLGSVECVGVSARIEKLRRQGTHQLAQFIKIAANELAANDLLPQRDFHYPALAVIGAANEMIQEWLTTDNALSAEDLSREIRGIFQALIRGARPSSELD